MRMPVEEAQGTCAARFERVREVFQSHFSDGLEVGASFAVVRRGEVLVDLWGGFKDRERRKPWTRDTIVNVYSTTKGVVSLLVAMLVAEGRIDYDAPVSRYWPEFSAHGKQDVTVATLLSHQAGLAAFPVPVDTSDLYDWQKMVSLLASAEPLWKPGERTGYHARSFGFLAGELIRRATGRSVGTWLRERLSIPHGLDLAIGLSARDDARAAEIVGPHEYWGTSPDNRVSGALAGQMQSGNSVLSMMGSEVRKGTQSIEDPEVAAMMRKVFINPINDPEAPNLRPWRAAELPSSNGHSNALSLARLYGAVAAGGTLGRERLVSPDALAQATRLESDRKDLVLGFPVRWARGFTLNGGEFGPHTETFGHRGIGGSLAYADPAQEIGVAYAMNKWIPKLGDYPGNDPRADRLVGAVYDCL